MRRRDMMARRVVMGGLALGALTLAGCGNADKFRYKMTVEVETPQGLRTGSAVRALESYEGGGFLFGEGRPGVRMTGGEAVAVDVAPGQVLFALLTGASGEVDYGTRIADRAIVGRDGRGWDRTPRVVELWPNAPQTTALANTNPLPMLVWFRDIADPKSVEEVKPNALSSAFGPGVRLRRITVQVTDESIAAGIGKRLRYLGRCPEPSLNPSHGPNDWSIAATLHHGDFRRGVEK